MLTFEQIKELIELVARYRLSGVEVERSGFRLKIHGVETVAAVAPAPERSAGAAGSAGAAAGQALPAAAALSGLPVHAGELGAAPPPGTPQAAGGTQGLAGSPGAEGSRPSRAAHILNSPIVGTFYRASSPAAPPFTAVGARVERGQVVCIIEAMKLMNEIESDVDGTVVEIYPQNAQAVEFGEPLFAIEPA